MIIRPARRIRGRLRLPGDKSISHRAAIIAALARGSSLLTNFSTSEDCASTLACLSQLGVSIEREGNTVRVEGVGVNGLRAPAAPLDCGNSGSTMRMLAGVLAGQNFASQLTGDDSLRSRPMNRIIVPLELMGANISASDGHAPLQINGQVSLEPIRYEMPVSSAQVKSCILLAGLNARGRTVVIEKYATRDHTERMLREFGVSVETTRERNDGLANEAEANIVTLDGPARFDARDINIPGDLSSATFFLAAAAMLKGSSLDLEALCLNSTRAEILRTLRALGADVHVSEPRDEGHELIGDVHINGGAQLSPLAAHANDLRGALIPQLIDELPMLAVLGTQIAGGLTIREAGELRFKETDRIAATVANLRAMGAQVEEYEDGLSVAGATRLHGAKLDARGDHRIAMAFTIAALIADSDSEIVGAECAAVSFPEFFQLLESVIKR
jgi:3-phosphoshikimate 1-carboxyvinyltransferase